MNHLIFEIVVLRRIERQHRAGQLAFRRAFREPLRVALQRASNGDTQRPFCFMRVSVVVGRDLRNGVQRGAIHAEVIGTAHLIRRRRRERQAGGGRRERASSAERHRRQRPAVEFVFSSTDVHLALQFVEFVL